MAHLRELTAEHERDLEWIIALWKAIHGGDPAPDGISEVTVDPATAMLGELFLASLAETTKTAPLSEAALEDALRGVGLITKAGGACPNGEVKVNVVTGSVVDGRVVIKPTGVSFCRVEQA